jgi:hypothetical protein
MLHPSTGRSDPYTAQLAALQQLMKEERCEREVEQLEQDERTLIDTQVLFNCRAGFFIVTQVFFIRKHFIYVGGIQIYVGGIQRIGSSGGIQQ